MAAEPVRALFRNEAGMSRTDECPLGFQKQRAPVGHNVHALRVEVRDCDVPAAAHMDFVSAVGAPEQSPRFMNRYCIVQHHQRRNGPGPIFLPRRHESALGAALAIISTVG